MQRKSKEEFVENAHKIHGNRYSYDNFIYVNNKVKGLITCPIHGDFLMRPDKHLWQKRGCPKCNGGVRLSTEEFIEKAKHTHGDIYDYSNVVYVNALTPVRIICPKHGEFLQKPVHHLSGYGCQKCGGSLPLNTEMFINRARNIHGDKYDYSKVEYVNYQTKVCIICPKHGEFWQQAEHHLNGVGCKLCRESHLERAVSMKLDSINVYNERQKKFDWLGLQSLDFYLPDYNIAIECQGEQHYKPCTFGGISKNKAISNLLYLQDLDKRKSFLCKENGVILEYINYDDDIDKRIIEILNI